jgi:hypothetical protein
MWWTRERPSLSACQHERLSTRPGLLIDVDVARVLIPLPLGFLDALS